MENDTVDYQCFWNKQVSIFGDGTSQDKTISRDVLNNYEKLVSIGTDEAVPTDVISSFSNLNSKIAT